MTCAPAGWTSNAGLPVRDLVPVSLRRAWVREGHCPDRDLYSLFREQVRAHPHRAAVIDATGTADYASLDRTVRHYAARLAEHGLGERDIVAVRLPDGRDAVAAELALAAVGAVALPYPPGHGHSGPTRMLLRSRARALIVARRADATLPQHLPHLEKVLTTADALDPDAGTSLKAPTTHTFVPPALVDPEAPVRILVSSGSEAEPKMVAYSHNAMAGGRASYLRALHDGPEPMRNLVLVPLGSSFGSLATSVTVAALGGTLVLPGGAFDAAAALRALVEHRPTHVFGVPTMLRRLADQPRVAGEDFTVLRAVVASGAALPEETARACRARFGRPVIAVYGSSDGVNCHTAATGLRPETGTGLPDPAVAQIRIADDSGGPVPDGHPGKILARGPMTPLCYVGSPELDARYRTLSGWVRTGDRGMLDSAGRLHVLGRLKEIVVRGGFNISPAEVERELGAHPSVAEVCCVGVPDADLGERLCACVRQPVGVPAVTLAELTAFLEARRGLERRKLPELLLRVERMPLGPTGKVCRATLARQAAGDGARHVR